MNNNLYDPFIKKKPDKMSSLKCKLISILREDNCDSTLSIINKAVQNVNILVTRTYQFIRLYLLHLYEQNISFPIIDEKFINLTFAILSIHKKQKTQKKTKIWTD
jgi:hypothetical protein